MKNFKSYWHIYAMIFIIILIVLNAFYIEHRLKNWLNKYEDSVFTACLKKQYPNENTDVLKKLNTLVCESVAIEARHSRANELNYLMMFPLAVLPDYKVE